MIQTRQDLHFYLRHDMSNISLKHLFVKWISCSDDYILYILLKCLRHYEYYLNKKKHIYEYIPYLWYWWNFRRLRNKANIVIFPNTLGAGLKFIHHGFR